MNKAVTRNPKGQLIVGRKTIIQTKPKVSDLSALGVTLTTEGIKARWEEVSKEFIERDQGWIRFLITGFGGSGKTYACVHTLPTPILFMIFDPNSEALIPLDMVEKGLILPVRYYGDDPNEPYLYKKWEADSVEWKKDGFLDAFASIVIDSFTNFIIGQMRTIAYDDMKAKATGDPKKRRKSLMPQLQDYNVLKLSTIISLLALCSASCHIVLNVHILEERHYRDMDDSIGYLKKMMNATPALRANVPPQFTEVYLAEEEPPNKNEKGKACEYSWSWVTRADKRFPEIRIRSFIAREIKGIENRVPQDFRALLKKANFHWEDKPPII